MRALLAMACASILIGCDPSTERTGPREPADPRPNVLLITVDTLRADRLGTYGYPLETSPNVDALATQGVVFERAVAASTATAPSHASIFTSRYVRDHTIGFANGASRLEGGVTLAELFREAGFETAAFVGNVVLQRRSGLDRGFGVYDDELTTPEDNRPDIWERPADETTRRALRWLADAGDPFFLWVHYQDPHGPYSPPDAWKGRVPVEPEPGEKPLRVLQTDSGWGGVPAYQALEGLSLPSEYLGRYADEILYTDHWIGELVGAVDGHDSGRPAVVLLTSDHGESLGEEDRWFVHYTGTAPDQAHVPFVLRAPGLAPERRRETVSHVDVLPTLLELAGLPVPEDASGVALGPPLRDGRELPARTVFCDIGDDVSAYSDYAFANAEGRWLKEVWLGLEAASEAASEPRWDRYVWWRDGTWARQKKSGGMPEPLRAYVERSTPIERTKMDDEVRARLRALGYVDP